MFRLFGLLFTAVLFYSMPGLGYDPDHVRQLKETGNCEGCDLRGVLFVADYSASSPPTVFDNNNSILTSILKGANLKAANLSGANLSGLNLEGANLTGAIMVNARLANANLKSANLKGADLKGAVLVEADLSGANLDKADLKNTNFFGAKLIGASFNGAVLNHTDLRYADLTNARSFGAALLDSRGQGKYREEYYDKGSDGCKTRMPSGIRVSYDCEHAGWNDESFQTEVRTQ